MPTFDYDQMQFHYRDTGEGLPFIFQHGLTGDVEQPFGLFSPPPGVRLIAMDCRGHGLTEPLGDPDKISLARFADDLAALMSHLQIKQAVVGGISMGSAVAINFALRYPQRVVGLVLSRPAWLEGPVPENVALYAEISGLIRQYGPQIGREIFHRSPNYERLSREAPAVAASLSHAFELPRIEQRINILERLPEDRPYRKLSQLAAIRVPVLVMANKQDPVHPFEFGEALAEAIGGAEFRELTPKSVSREQHAADVQRHIEKFLTKHFLAAQRPADDQEPDEEDDPDHPQDPDEPPWTLTF